MTHDAKVCFLDAVSACELIIKFTENTTLQEYVSDLKTKSAAERQFEILGEALNRIKKLDVVLLDGITKWESIIAFRNVIAHVYNAIDDEIVFSVISKQIPILLSELRQKI